MKILIADDESIIRMGLKSMLRALGHEVFAAKNGQDALQQAKRYSPELAILDIRMPYKDGLQVAKELCDRQPMPIIMLTAESGEQLIERASSLKIHGYLIKPIKSPAELMAVISIATKRFADQEQEIQKRIEVERKLSEKDILARSQMILMKKHQLNETDAYKKLQDTARNGNRKMVDVGADIIMVNRAERILRHKFSISAESAHQRITSYAMDRDLPIRKAAEELMYVESAKSILMTKHHLSDEAAMEQIRQQANRNKRSLLESAKLIVIKNRKPS